MLPSPFCPFTGARILALRATVLMLLTLQTLLFLAVSGTVAVAGTAALLYTAQQRRRSVA